MDTLTNKLLTAWEETYKKGQLTFWIFLSLKEGKKYVDEIKDFVQQQSNNTISCEAQSLYRNLRKYKHLNVVNYEIGKGRKGPDRKYYYLTKMGNELLMQFIDRNINILIDDKIKTLIKK